MYRSGTCAHDCLPVLGVNYLIPHCTYSCTCTDATTATQPSAFCLQALCLLTKAHVDMGSAVPALNCINRLRSDVPDVGGNNGMLPLLALRAQLQLDRHCLTLILHVLQAYAWTAA